MCIFVISNVNMYGEKGLETEGLEVCIFVISNIDGERCKLTGDDNTWVVKIEHFQLLLLVQHRIKLVIFQYRKNQKVHWAIFCFGLRALCIILIDVVNVLLNVFFPSVFVILDT